LSTVLFEQVVKARVQDAKQTALEKKVSWMFAMLPCCRILATSSIHYDILTCFAIQDSS